MTRILSILSISIISANLFATTPVKPEFVEEIVRFHNDPATVMNEIPVKTPVVGDETMLDYMRSPLGHKPLGLGDIVEIKDGVRSTICRVKDGVQTCADEEIGRAAIESNDHFINLIDSNPSIVRKLEDIENKNLLSKELSEQPWSDDYWAIANGVLAHRYAHESGEKEHQWDQALSKFKDSPTQDLIDQGLIHMLSPAEKYDLLVGDKNYTLTNAMFLEGKQYYDRSGKVEPWMGICHGWAAAAYMLPRPKKTIWVKSSDGKYDIPFYPADIKALGSLLYAKNKYESTFIGGRCNTKDPKRDENGRVIDQECFDNNPASWHFAVVNQIGLNNRSMIIDATFDYEVWNQPVLSYDIKYFNPEKYIYASNLQDAKTTKAQFTTDKFKKYRDPRTVAYVGIEMDIKYIVETTPRPVDQDSEQYDGIKEVTYRYDLELDKNNNVIGGEWYTNLHPDFLWTPTKTTSVRTQTDTFLASRGVVSWSKENRVPKAVGHYASYESRRGSPLALIVNELFEAASSK